MGRVRVADEYPQMSARLRNALHNEGFDTWGDVVSAVRRDIWAGEKWEARFMGAPNVGRKCVEELAGYLASSGVLPGPTLIVCPKCHGRGKIRAKV